MANAIRSRRRNPAAEGCGECGCICGHCEHAAPLPGQLSLPGNVSGDAPVIVASPPCPRCHRCQANCCECETCSACDALCDSTCSNCGQCAECCSCATCSSCRASVNSVCSLCERCQVHCECSHCVHCGDPVDLEHDFFCDECNRCESCCNCTRCSECGEVVDSICEHCNNCESCCDCSHESEDEEDEGTITRSGRVRITRVRAPPDWPLHAKKLDRSAPVRFAGTEIEFIPGRGSQHELQRVVAKWSCAIVDDCSVKPDETELVTAPAKGKAFLEELEEITSALATQNASVNDSCGLHVHVDGHDFYYRELRRLMMMWEALEPGLFLLVPTSRRNHGLLKRCGIQYGSAARGSKNLTEAIYRGSHTKHVKGKAGKEVCVHVYPYHFRTGKAGASGERVLSHEDKRRFKYDQARYHTLNLHAWYFQGTLEYRMHSGTTNLRKITNWVIYLTHITELASRWSDSQLDDWLALQAEGNRSDDRALWRVLSLAPNAAIAEYVQQRYEQFAGQPYDGPVPAPYLLPKMNPPRRGR